MAVVIVIVSALCIFIGMFVSVKVFGTGGKRARMFDDIYFSIEDVDGIGVFYTKHGDYSATLLMDNPVQKFSADTDGYYAFTTLFGNILRSLGEGYALQKQDIFVRRSFDPSSLESTLHGPHRFLSEAYFRYFKGRPYTEARTYLTITQEYGKTGLSAFDRAKWNDFLVKIRKVSDQLHDGGVLCRFLTVTEAREYVDRYLCMDFKSPHVHMTDFSVGRDGMHIGSRESRIFSLLDIDHVGLPNILRPYAESAVNNTAMPEDLLSGIDHIEGADTVVYNQVIFIPAQRRIMGSLAKKRNRHASLPNPSNLIAVEDIKKVEDEVARNDKQLVYAHFDLIVTLSRGSSMEKTTNALDNMFARRSMHLSDKAFNQLELFVGSFPGNCYQINKDYDRFLLVSDAALCLMYKERQSHGDDTPVKCFYTDRQGVPMAVDTTGKEGRVKYTNNSNFFVLGPSGSGKSFFMNTVVRQYYEQDTDVVIIDTGDSYEGLNDYFGGAYITYTKEKPISMNPFKVTLTEYEQNFEEKKDFLKSLVFLIFKGSSEPTKLEDVIISQTITEYFEAYFHPFTSFTPAERDDLRGALLLEDKKSGRYDDLERRLQEKYGEEYDVPRLDELMARRAGTKVSSAPTDERMARLMDKLRAVIADKATTDSEKATARRKLADMDPAMVQTANVPSLLTPEVIEETYMTDIERRIDKIERQRRKLAVTELSFNTYYEFAVERIPQIMRQDHVEFDIDNFAKILKPFYRGGDYETTLNSDMDSSLFNERFIVFEIDKIKDNKDLFPIVVLIIMDVFTQKMRIKKGRKCLVIEEAWKAIATPVMASYIKYLYKTARKHWAMVGVVTQEIQDITGSQIVKDAIISNSDVFMLLDQSKFKDKFDDIRATLALTDIDCRKIFTINRLDNKEGRGRFKEVFIRRGQDGEVFGVEEPLECYMCYTTEKAEKEALKVYRSAFATPQEAISAFVRDFHSSGERGTLEFSKKVLSSGHPLGSSARQYL